MDSIRILKRLEDMLGSIDAIESYVDRFPRRFDIFHSESMYRSAVLYHIAVIGEALNQLLKLSPTIKISSARKIVNTRNNVIHGYDSLDDEILWSIVINHLPTLKAETTQLISEIQSQITD
ncbi:MAG: DUF86 domain-containing protein [Muribaculum sp.]|nr:DUF86 domain-containing protein [Muribaculum sp.]